jgi:hypothetical protein
MTSAEKRTEAELLYIRQSMSCPKIAEKLKVDKGTVYRWKADAETKGESFDWEVQRRIYNLSPLELTAIYADALKTYLTRMKTDPGLISDPKVADAISKHVNSMERIGDRRKYLGVANDLIRIINMWLTENQPELKEKLDPYWESIHEELVSYYEKEIKVIIEKLK